MLKQYQHRFKFILVDEYQDTNIVQYLWLWLLCSGAVHASAHPFLQPFIWKTPQRLSESIIPDAMD